MWRDAAFWSLVLAALLATLVLAALDNPILRQQLELLTTHEKSRRFTESGKVRVLLEHLRWWILILPLLALAVRWAFPSAGDRGHRRAGSLPGNRSPRFLRVPPVAVGLLALQIGLGAGFLTGTYSYIRDRFRGPGPRTLDEIRNEFLPTNTLRLADRIRQVVPDNEDIFVLVDPGDTPVFLNYYLYPRRLYSPEDGAFIEEAEVPEFWERMRQEGYRWVYIYRPGVDPVGGGHLIELPPRAGSPSPEEIGSPVNGTQPDSSEETD